MTFQIMPQEQTGIDYLLETLGQGAAGGVQGALENFYKQKETQKKGKQFESAGLPAAFASLDPQIVKSLIPAMQKQKLLDQIFSRGNEANQMNSFERDKAEDATRNLSEDEILATSLIDPNLARIMQSQKKMRQQENLANRKETGSLRLDYAKKGEEAEKSLRNKEQMMTLIEKGDLTNPIVAGIANVLPFNLDQFLLSNDSQLYRSMMFENFAILKSMFPGQIRVKEIELLEDKLAGLEKNDEAKKAIIRNQMNLAKADIVRSEAAAEVEEKYPYLGVSSFNKKVNEISKPKLDKLYSEYIDELNNIVHKYQSVYNKLPAADKSKNKVFLDENTGKKYRSDGKTWKVFK